MSGHLRVEREGEVLVLTLDRPDRLNALNPELMDDLAAAFLAAALPEETARVIVLRGEGRAFCAGADLNSMTFAAPGPGRAQRQYAMQRRSSGVIRAMRSCPQPIIALCQGAVCGGGFSLALAADVRIATPDLKMNAAYLRVGLGGTDMGSGYLLTRLIGHSAASALLLTGDFLGAEQARGNGLVAEVVALEDLRDAGMAWARKMLRASPLGLKMTKEALNILVDCSGLEAGLALEDRQQVMLLETEDHRAALRAWTAREEPEYRNE